MKVHGIIESFNCAIEGFIFALKTQRNMRIHFLLAIAVLLVAIYSNFKGIELLILCGAITLVLLSEMINTAIELTIDLVHDSFNPLVRTVKDLMAGVVLVASVNAIIVGYLLFSKRLNFSLEEGLLRVRQSSWHITFICLIVVLTLVVMIKVIFHKGTPLRGGMPSGHSAMAFSIWTIIVVITNNGLIAVLAFVMAFLIARSRLVSEIHNVWEVITGSVLGVLVTSIVFQVLR
ncbi:MAG: diacylglycerol kinase [Candidatus Omnitrophica bacterium]|nr:diacylglycerol kinase [Candidatus Omnitrophota bacterium]